MASWVKHPLLLYFSKKTTYLFIKYRYFKSYRILSHCLTPFCLLPASDQLSEELYFIVFSLPFFPLLSQLGLYSSLLLVCFSHPLKIIFLYCRYLTFTFTFLQYSYSHSTFIKLHSAVIATNPAVVFWQFCSGCSSTFSILLRTS